MGQKAFQFCLLPQPAWWACRVLPLCFPPPSHTHECPLTPIPLLLEPVRRDDSRGEENHNALLWMLGKGTHSNYSLVKSGSYSLSHENVPGSEGLAKISKTHPDHQRLMPGLGEKTKAHTTTRETIRHAASHCSAAAHQSGVRWGIRSRASNEEVRCAQRIYKQ